MGYTIIDKRGTKGTSDNRQRFLKKIKRKIIDSIPNIITNEKMEDLMSKKGHVKVPIKDVNEPEFNYDFSTGRKERVLPGNKEYTKGDKLRKPNGEESGSGSKGSNDDTITEDDFVIILNKDEFMQYFFEDLELPNLIKKSLQDLTRKKYERAGYSNDGSYNHLNIVKTYKKSLSRRLGVCNFLKKRIKELEDELKGLISEEKKNKIKEDIEILKKRLNSILFFDNIDLAYNFYEPRPRPITRAAMFMIMDVSGSMTFEHKDLAKRFFMLLYMFLMKNYEKVDLIFVKHHSKATEVSEYDFFNSPESGGTVVLPALELVYEIMQKRYANDDVNLYCCQCSDGDVWDKTDAQGCKEMIEQKLLDKLQYMAYLDIEPINEEQEDKISGMNFDSDLYNSYKTISSNKFACKRVSSVEQIWHVFKDLFSKEKTK